MKNALFAGVFIFIASFLTNCGSNISEGQESHKDPFETLSSLSKSSFNEQSNQSQSEEGTYNMKIDDKTVDISWEENSSVKALQEYAKNGLSISMHRYGGFEQVGPIGTSIVNDDKEMTTEPGDVVLYSSNQIVIFFGSNSWSYTKLGHLNMDQDQLKTLLDKSNVTLWLGQN